MPDINFIRSQFPILNQKINGFPLIYFDNGATTQKPNCVIDAISNFYKTSNSNIHRGVHSLSRKATEEFEKARTVIASHFNISNSQQLIFNPRTSF
jgi:cysteine desulfurase / selenocysteine lyase